MLIVITSGGVKEKIDNVRSITNSSSGKLGLKIANTFLELCKGCEIIYIHGKDAEPCNASGNVENIKITSTQDLMKEVTNILTTRKVDIFVHSMAVADYATSYVIDFGKLRRLVQNVELKNLDNYIEECRIPSNGKISSEIEEPAVIMEKTPKVIEKIKELAPHTFLVGFKLLDGVTEEKLFDVGFNLLRKNRCNLVLANDIKNIRKGNHRGMLIYPEKTFDIAEGKDNIAKLIVKKSIERSNVRHPKSIQKSENNTVTDELFKKFFDAGRWLDVKDFLPKVINHDRPDMVGTYGNMSCKEGNDIYITCRNVNKSNLKITDISKIESVNIVDGKNVYSNVFYNSIIKPSIDTTIHSEIYRHSNFSHIVHIHTDRVFLGHPLVADAYPCGCDLECEAIVNVVKDNPNVRVIQMKKHGLIILGNSFDECSNIIENLFTEVPYIDYGTNDIDKDCTKHIDDVRPDFYNKEIAHPLKINENDIGCILEAIDENDIHFGIYTMPIIRGKGLHIVEKYLKLYEYPHSYILHTTLKCEIADFYKSKYGFEDFDVSNDNDLKYVLYKY